MDFRIKTHFFTNERFHRLLKAIIIFSECNKLAWKPYKPRYDRVGKAINWELRNELRTNNTN